MRPRILAFLCVASAVWIVAGCGREPAAPPADPDRLVLYSIDGRSVDPETRQRIKTDEEFHGFPVLGKVEIDKASDRKAIVNAVHEGIAQSNGMKARCFVPRHGLRVETNDNAIDYVICFECLQIDTYANGERTNKPTTSAPQAMLNQYLKAANVPLAPGMVGD